MTGAESAPIHAYKFWGLGGWLVKDYMSNQPFGMFWSLIVDHPKLSNYQECRGLHVCKSYRKSEVYGYAHFTLPQQFVLSRQTYFCIVSFSSSMKSMLLLFTD